MKWAIVISLVLAVIVSSADAGCLNGFRVLGSTPTSITVGWNYTCDEQARFKVYYEHKGWNACSEHGDTRVDESRGSGVGNAETDQHAISFEHLHPFSLYRLSIKALVPREVPEEAAVIAETLPDLPGVSPRTSSIKPR